jgi:predicted enzyme related to lactoylglutathione lyase
VIQDPQGAFFMLWQPNQHRGAQLVNAPGAFSWNELQTTDLEAARGFYSELFGWSVEPFPDSPEPYFVIMNAGRSNGGISRAQGPTPPNWLVYFGTGDIDAAISKVAELGGGTIAGPIEIPNARIAVVHDPQGAVFALYDGTFEP